MIDRVQDGASEMSHTTLRKVWTDLWPNLAGLLGANLLLLAWCIPAVLAWLLGLRALAIILVPLMVGPAVVGLFTYAGNLVLERQASVWQDSLRGFRSGFPTGAIPAVVAMLAVSAHRLALQAVLERDQSPEAVLLWAGQLAILLTLAIVSVHFYSLVGLYHQGAREALRNALLLAFAHPMPTFGLLGAGVLAFSAARGLHWAPLSIFPALLAVLASNNTVRLVMHHRPAGGN